MTAWGLSFSVHVCLLRFEGSRSVAKRLSYKHEGALEFSPGSGQGRGVMHASDSRSAEAELGGSLEVSGYPAWTNW